MWMIALLMPLMFWRIQNSTRLLNSLFLVPCWYNSVYCLKWLLQGAALQAQPAPGKQVYVSEGFSHELAEQDNCYELPVCLLAHTRIVQVTCCLIMSSVLPALFFDIQLGVGGGRSVGWVLEGRCSTSPKGSYPSPDEMCWIMNAL